MSSPRGVKKGPGRRPQSAKRQGSSSCGLGGGVCGRGPRGRCVAVFGGELVAWAQGLSQRCGGWVRRAVGSAGGPSDQFALPVPGRAHRDRRSASVRAGRAGDRWSARTRAVDHRTGTSAQRGHRPRVSPVRCSSPRHRAAGTPAPTPNRHQQRDQWCGRRAASAAVEPAADEPSSSIALRRRPVHVVVS